MKTDVYFKWNNIVEVVISEGENTLFGIEGKREAVEQALRFAISRGERLLKIHKALPEYFSSVQVRIQPIKDALAKLLYTPISWDG